MPKLHNGKVPAYRRHKQSGRAVVTLNGRDFLLGPYGTRASRREYDRVINEWLAAGRQLPDAPNLTVAELILRFWEHAKRYYGQGSGELSNFKHALRPLKQLYAATPAAEFGPLALKAVRQAMIKQGRTRKSLNKNVARIKMVFKWGVENELLPPSSFHALQAVAGLRRGRSEARESEPVKPVPEHVVMETLKHLSATHQAMVRLQLYTGMRPGELCMMRTGDIDTSGKVWCYTPQRHKTEHHGHARTIWIGPKAQDVLRPFLKPDLQAYVFSPADADAERRRALSAARTTPLHYGNKPGSNRTRKPKRKPGAAFSVSAYRRAIARACEAAFEIPDELRDPGRGSKAEREQTPEQRKARQQQRRAWHAEHVWHPHQLRHTAATYLRKQYGVEVARAVLGHATLAATEVYAAQDAAVCVKVMGEVG